MSSEVAKVATARSVLGQLVLGSRGKYLGISTLLAWHYCLWFVPSTFPQTFLLSDRITFAWLVALGTAVVTLAILALGLGRSRHLAPTPLLIGSTASLGAAGTGFLTSYGQSSPSLGPAIGAALAIGVSSAVLWVLWGERYAVQKAKFTIMRLAPTYSGFLLVAIVVTYLLPGWLAPTFVTALPVVAGVLLLAHVRALPVLKYPHLLPRKESSEGTRAIATVSVISFVASFVSYYTVAIIPWEDLGPIDASFMGGIMIGAALILALAPMKWLLSGRFSIFQLFPWLVMHSIIACVLFISDLGLNVLAFLLALATSSMFEVLLTMYMGGLTLRGYMAPATAFALSGVAIRLGVLLGNGTALTYERVPGWHDVLVTPTFIVLVIVLTGLLITLVRQEFVINELVRPAQSVSEIDRLVANVADEFKLSERETEIVALIGRGYTAAAVAEQLVISPYTVNTHIKHIYGKMRIHKRAELISYLHRRD